MKHEIEEIRSRYARRQRLPGSVYSLLSPAVYMGEQEKERCLIRWIRLAGLMPVAKRRVLEIGCGTGANLLQLLRLGFAPENIVGNELLEERAAQARHILPAGIRIVTGDACRMDFGAERFDVVLQSTVFTSILDDAFQQTLADRMWSFVTPGGGILWYDYIYNNPSNPDVRGVPVRRIRELFPEGAITTWRVTLAPPISRRVTRIHPCLYTLFNCLPFLRTHVLGWIRKKGGDEKPA